MFKVLIGIFKRKRRGITVLIVLLLALAIWAGYQVVWTGFNKRVLWDWMELLIIPMVLSLGALLFQRAERKIERENTLDKQRQEALMTYYDRMDTLLLQSGLRESKEKDEVRTLARTRTLAVLRNLDSIRKRYALQFLYDAGCVRGDKPIVELDKADLNEANLEGILLMGINLRRAYMNLANFKRSFLSGGDLSFARLNHAKLNHAIFEGANLSNAELKKANLEGAWLNGARMGWADLEGANMKRVDMHLANLRGANLKWANLEGSRLDEALMEDADLEGVNLTNTSLIPEQLARVLNLRGAIMPDGTKYEQWLNNGKPDWNKTK